MNITPPLPQTTQDLFAIATCIQDAARLLSNAVDQRNKGYGILWSGDDAEIEARLNLYGPATVQAMFEADSSFAASANSALLAFGVEGYPPNAVIGKPRDFTYDSTGFHLVPLPAPDDQTNPTP